MRQTSLSKESANVVRCQAPVKQDLHLILEAQRSFYLTKLCAFKEEDSRWVEKSMLLEQFKKESMNKR